MIRITCDSSCTSIYIPREYLQGKFETKDLHAKVVQIKPDSLPIFEGSLIATAQPSCCVNNGIRQLEAFHKLNPHFVEFLLLGW